MIRRAPDVDRRTLLRGVGAGLVPLAAGGAAGAPSGDSTPSYRLRWEVLEASRDRFHLRFDNELARDFAGAVTAPLGDCRGVRVRNGEKRWQRHEDDWQDVRVAFEVAAGESVELLVECVSNEP